MNEERTKELPNKKSFEERVFARFDAFDARFDSVATRFDTVDARLEKLEARSYDTKPIWQRALKAIMELGLEMGEVKSKVGVIESKVSVIEGKVQLVENEIGIMKTDYKGIRDELIDVRREVRNNLREKLDLILKFLLEDRDDIRDAEGRIRELESKIA
jgi:chromosome segregation ATPase